MHQHVPSCRFHCPDGVQEHLLSTGALIDTKIRAAIKVECDRQHVGEDRQAMLYGQYLLCRGAAEKNIVMELSDIRLFASLIEPSNLGFFRGFPVSFNGIVGGVSPYNLERSMTRWVEWFNETLVQKPLRDEFHVDPIIKEFLDIHPFSDGNGRTAWLLRVWMLNQWDDPRPLPDYFKEA